MIVAFENAFAGRSTLMAEITDNPAYREGLPEYHEVLRLPWYDKNNPRSAEITLAKFKEHVEKHGSNIGVFVFEPMLGEGGYMPAPREFFVPLLELCREHKIPVWMDEVQTFLRTGEAFAFQTLDLGDYADLVTIAKTAQFGATLYTEEMNPKPGLIAGTFSGSSSSLRAGISILEEMRSGGYFGPQGRIAEIHRYFTQGLEKLGNSSCQGKVSDVAGLGLMIAFTPLDGSKEKVNAFSQKLFQNGLISFTCGKNPVRIRFLIPASVTNQELDWALQIIEKTLMESA
jgi:acetylornithine/N-succinyldiaminopimelate aminotransferase